MMNILVVDDSAVMRSIIIKTLRMCDVEIGEIFQASNGKEGLERLEKNWVDLVLVDVNMPVMDGEQMIKYMRENPLTRDLPVLVVSTESSQSRIEMLEKMSSGFVHKPFNPEVVRNLLFKVIGGGDVKGAGTETSDGGGQSF